MTAIILHRSDPAKNLHRYYRLDVQRDLFGEWYFTLITEGLPHSKSRECIRDGL
jgi:hypothetical protein